MPDAFMPEVPPRLPVVYENYPGPVTGPEPVIEPRVAGGAGRGLVTGMSAAALTVIVGLPSRFAPEIEPTAVIGLTVMYAVAAAVIGTAPGAAAGAMLAALARAGATRLPIRLIGGMAAATAASAVSTPLCLLNWPGLAVATLCGAFAAPWVAWSSAPRTLD